jgi:hypothetical protein
VSGVAVVAKAIADLQEDAPVKQCLRSLFSFELEHAELRMPSYTEKYVNTIVRYAKDWTPSPEEGD